MPDWVTRTAWLRIPRWRSGYAKPVNWLWFRWYDFLPLAVGLIVLPGDSVLMLLLAVWYVVAMPVLMFLRLRRRRRWCEAHAHHPFKPVPQINEWECLWCGAALVMDDPELVATSVAHAVSEVESARRVSQAKYSDRR